jgi:hypothetical protein
MDTMNHTKEPWRIGPPSERGLKFSKYLRPILPPEAQWAICTVKHNRHSARLDEVRQIVDANAERIVSCVNACAGIPDPSVIPEIVDLLLDLDDLTASSFLECVRRSKLKVLRLLERAGVK